MGAVRCEPWCGLHCPWSLSLSLSADELGEFGRVFKVLGWFTGRHLAKARHDCDTTRIISIPGTKYLLLRIGKNVIFFLRICSLAGVGEEISLGVWVGVRGSVRGVTVLLTNGHWTFTSTQSRTVAVVAPVLQVFYRCHGLGAREPWTFETWICTQVLLTWKIPFFYLNATLNSN